MSERDIVIGITPVNLQEYVLCGAYPAHAGEEDPDRIQVVEIANARLAHTRLPNGHPDGRIAVFSRWITATELSSRTELYERDETIYRLSILVGTRGKNTEN